MFSNNLRLMVIPDVLSYDWQMGSIPLVDSLLDLRNASSLFAVVLCATFAIRLALGRRRRPLEVINRL